MHVMRVLMDISQARLWYNRCSEGEIEDATMDQDAECVKDAEKDDNLQFNKAQWQIKPPILCWMIKKTFSIGGAL